VSGPLLERSKYESPKVPPDIQSIWEEEGSDIESPMALEHFEDASAGDFVVVEKKRKKRFRGKRGTGNKK
jgi:hypothetical protein